MEEQLKTYQQLLSENTRLCQNHTWLKKDLRCFQKTLQAQKVKAGTNSIPAAGGRKLRDLPPPEVVLITARMLPEEIEKLQKSNAVIQRLNDPEGSFQRVCQTVKPSRGASVRTWRGRNVRLRRGRDAL